jgi:hypothetical protein
MHVVMGIEVFSVGLASNLGKEKQNLVFKQHPVKLLSYGQHPIFRRKNLHEHAGIAGAPSNGWHSVTDAPGPLQTPPGWVPGSRNVSRNGRHVMSCLPICGDFDGVPVLGSHVSDGQ